MYSMGSDFKKIFEMPFHYQKIEVNVNILLFQSLGDIYLDSLYFPIRSIL